MAAEAVVTKYSKFFALIAISAFLSVATVVFGALPLLPARRVGQRWIFWFVQLAIALGFTVAGLPFYGLIVLAQTLAIGVYVEVEQHGGTVFTSGAVAILASIGAAGIAGGIWLKTTKFQLGEKLRQQVEPLVAQLSTMNSGSNSMLNTEAVIQQLPSAAVIALVLSLAIALIGERKVMASVKARDARAGSADALLGFRMPDGFVWLVVFTIAGAFLKHGRPMIEIASVNLLNVLVVLYFFQGLAVVAAAFRTFKVGAFWQAIWYVLLVLQLFLMVSLLGFADYWLEFRERLNRRPAEPNRSF